LAWRIKSLGMLLPRVPDGECVYNPGAGAVGAHRHKPKVPFDVATLLGTLERVGWKHRMQSAWCCCALRSHRPTHRAVCVLVCNANLLWPATSSPRRVGHPLSRLCHSVQVFQNGRIAGRTAQPGLLLRPISPFSR
jgi:hypothetical protein